jgi:hypothetical protein
MLKKLPWLLLLAATPVMADAPFCLVTNMGYEQCWYWSLQACQQAAATQPNSFCIYQGR